MIYGSPRLLPAVILGALAIAFLIAAWQLDRLEKIAAGLILLAFVFAAGAVGAGLNWLVYEWSEREAEIRRARSVTPRLLELQAAARLTPDQAAVVPQIAYNTEIGLIPGADDEPQYVLITPGGTVPLSWIYDFLMDSGVTYLRSINTYADKTPGRLFAQLFTDWCVRHGLAVPHNGPHSAAWVNEHAKSRCARMLRISLDD